MDCELRWEFPLFFQKPLTIPLHSPNSKAICLPLGLCKGTVKELKHYRPFITLRLRQNGWIFEIHSNVWKLFYFDWNLFEICSWIFAIAQHRFRQWFGTEQAPSHYMNQCWPRCLSHITSLANYVLWGESMVRGIDGFPAYKCSVIWGFDVFFDIDLNELLNNLANCWQFEMHWCLCDISVMECCHLFHKKSRTLMHISCRIVL